MGYLLVQLVRQFFSGKRSHFLVVFQNNNELRSTGGYATNVLDLEVGKWGMKKRFLDVNTDLKHEKDEAPPGAMARLLKVKSVQFRDANYDPDFGRSAALMEKLYGHSFPEHDVTLITAVNFRFLERLLEILGPVKVHGKQWTAQNVFFEMSTDAANIDLHNKEARAQRKSSIKLLFQKLVRMAMMKPWLWWKLRTLFWNAVAMKDLQCASSKKKIADGLTTRGLLKSFSFETPDFLAVVDNNYLGSKSNRYVRRSVQHDVRFEFDKDKKALGDALVKVRLQFDHLGGLNYPLSAGYQSFVQLFIPRDAEIVATSTDCSIEKKNDFSALGFQQLIQWGKQASYEFSYRLPTELFQKGYAYTFWGQSGAMDGQLVESVYFPQQIDIRHVDGSEKVQEHVARYEGLAQDHHYSLTVHPHQGAPRIYFHEIVRPNEIEIQFNEPVSIEGKAADAVAICDSMNKDPIEVERVVQEKDDRFLKIIVKDLPATPNRFYDVVLTNIYGLGGNGFRGNEKKVTVVYRPQFFRKD